MIVSGVVLGLLLALTAKASAEDTTTDAADYDITSDRNTVTDSEGSSEDTCRTGGLQEWLSDKEPYAEMTANDTIEVLSQMRQARKEGGRGVKLKRRTIAAVRIGGPRPFGMAPPDSDLDVILVGSDVLDGEYFATLESHDQAGSCGSGHFIQDDHLEESCNRTEGKTEGRHSVSIPFRTPECGCVTVRTFVYFEMNNAKYLMSPKSSPEHMKKFFCVNPNFIPKTVDEEPTDGRGAKGTERQHRKDMKKQARKEARKERRVEKVAQMAARKQEKAAIKENRKEQMKELRKEARRQLMEERKQEENGTASEQLTLRQKIRELRRQMKKKRFQQMCEGGASKTYGKRWFRKHCWTTAAAEEEKDTSDEVDDLDSDELEKTHKKNGNRKGKEKAQVVMRNETKEPEVFHDEENSLDTEEKESELNNQTLALLDKLHEETHEEDSVEEADEDEDEADGNDDHVDKVETRATKKHKKQGRKIKKWKKKMQKKKQRKVFTKEMKMCCRQGLEHRKLILFLKDSSSNSTLKEDCSSVPNELLIWAKFKFNMKEQDCSALYSKCCEAWRPNLLPKQETKEAKKILKQLKEPKSAK